MTTDDSVRIAGRIRLGFYLDGIFRNIGPSLYGEQSFGLYLAEMADHLDRLVVIGRQARDGDQTSHSLGSRVELMALPYYEKATSLRTSWKPMLEALRSYWRLLDDVDGVWLCLGPSPLSFPFAVLARARGRWIVLGVRQNTPDYVRSRHPGRRWIHLVARVMDTGHRAMALRHPVVAVGPQLAQRFSHSPRLLPFSVSLVRERELAREPQPRDYEGAVLNLLSVGRLSAEKNPLMLADVLAGLRSREPRWRLVVCGEGPLRGALEDRLGELGLSDHADLLGYVPIDSELPRVYARSHAFLNPSRTEGVPQVLFEAWAGGLPTVATAVGGVPQAAGDAAMLVRSGDAAAAVDALTRIASDRDLRDRLVTAGRRRVEEHTLEAECRRIVSFLADVARGRDGGPA